MRSRGPQTRIGISGWRYAPWRRDFYPAGLPQREELAYASRQLNTIEINGSFYSLQRPESYARWYAETPADFRFSVKGSRFITHNKKLGDVEVPLANFLASGVLLLKEKLGPFLWQLAPATRYRPERIEEFFALLPKTTEGALRLARRHDSRVEGRSWLGPTRNRALRHVIEPRHESFFVPGFAAACRNGRSWRSPAAGSIPSRSTAPSTRCSGRSRMPGGTRTRPPTSSFR